MNRGMGFAVAVLMMLGCAVPVTVLYDYDTQAEYASLRTFSWMPAEGSGAADDLLVRKIRRAVDAQLQAKGRTEVTENADFLVAMRYSGKTVYGGSTTVGASVGIPVGRAGTISVGGGKSRPREKRQGELVLEFTDAKTKALVWRATAEAEMRPAASPEEQQERINKVTAKIFENFPPKK
jgi:hypothetical protein